MNDRLKELYLRAHSTRYYDGDPALDGNPPTVYWQGEVSAQRFAELIVRECTSQIEKVRQLQTQINPGPEYIQGFEDGMFVAIRTVKERFGVEG